MTLSEMLNVHDLRLPLSDTAGYFSEGVGYFFEGVGGLLPACFQRVHEFRSVFRRCFGGVHRITERVAL